MKRIDLVRHLEAHDCQLLREGSNHSVYVNRVAGKTSTVPRHREINEYLAQKICKDLEVPLPSGRVETRRGSSRSGESL
jgi:predicted RNA binding protein YcfA (HicA-like mRNA interferase family)